MVAHKVFTDADELDHALDACGRILTALGRDAFSVADRPADAVRADFEGWAAHLLRLAPPPGQRAVLPRRAWVDLTRFVADHRQLERASVEQNMATFKDAIEGVVRVFERAIAADRTQDAKLRAQVERLQRAATNGALEELRKAALETAENMAAVLIEREAEQKRSSQDLAHRVERLDGELQIARQESEIDPLTRLANRRALDQALGRAVKLRSMGQAAGLLLADVDHFKRVNDELGHPAGDEVLRRLANCLARTFHRKSDVLARYGGEELCVLLPDVDPAEMPGQADRFLRAVRSMVVPGVPRTITISIGYACLLTGETVEEWLARTDRALYRAKREGRDRAVAADPT